MAKPESGSFRPAPVRKGAGAKPPDAANAGGQVREGVFGIQLEIAYAAAERVVRTKYEGKVYELPLPTPFAFRAFQNAVDRVREAQAERDEMGINLAFAEAVYILQHQRDDDFDPRTIPDDAGVVMMRAFDFVDVAVYLELLLEVANRLPAVLNFSRPPASGRGRRTEKENR